MLQTAFLNIGTPELIIILLAGIFALIPIICLIDVLRSDFKDSTTKLIWVLVILLLPVLGCILYLIIGRSNKIR